MRSSFWRTRRTQAEMRFSFQRVRWCGRLQMAATKRLSRLGGELTLLAEGSITIQVQDVDTAVTATKTLTLVQGPTNGIIIIVS